MHLIHIKSSFKSSKGTANELATSFRMRTTSNFISLMNNKSSWLITSADMGKASDLPVSMLNCDNWYHLDGSRHGVHIHVTQSHTWYGLMIYRNTCRLHLALFGRQTDCTYPHNPIFVHHRQPADECFMANHHFSFQLKYYVDTSSQRKHHPYQNH